MRNDRNRSQKGHRVELREALESPLGALTSYRHRFFIVLILIFCVACLGKLFYIQIIEHNNYAHKAQNIRTNNITLVSKRGTIYDREGRILAQSVDAYDVVANPYQINQAQEIAHKLAEIFQGDERVYLQKLQQNKGWVLLEKQADPSQLTELRKKRYEGLYYEKNYKRIYPYGELGAQVVGLVGQDGHGTTGLEKYYDDVLSGNNGKIIAQFGTGKAGVMISDSLVHQKELEDGHDIRISIDIDIQRAAQLAISKGVQNWGAISGTSVVYDPKTGEILACCSTPYLNPNDRAHIEPESLKLRAVSDAYEPGSTFKPITASIGVDLHTTNPDKVYSIPPGIKVGDHTVTDITKHGYLSYTLRDILINSSNIGSVMVANEIGAQRYWDYIKKYQLGEKTGVDYPGDSRGILRDINKWNGSTLGSMAFGQGISVTPLQISRAIGAIANDGFLRKPHFLIDIDGVSQPVEAPQRIIEAKTAHEVADMMFSVVDRGTGKAGKIPGYKISGKTGTAQRADSVHGGYIKNSNTANFIGFAPTDNPRLLTYVLIEGTPDGMGGTTAGPIFKEIMVQALQHMKIQPENKKAYDEGRAQQERVQEQEDEQRKDLLDKTRNTTSDNKKTEEKEAGEHKHHD